MDIEINSEESCGIGEFYGEQIILEQEINNYNDNKKIYEKCNEDILLTMCNEIFNFEKMKIVFLGKLEEKEFNKLCKKVFSKK